MLGSLVYDFLNVCQLLLLLVALLFDSHFVFLYHYIWLAVRNEGKQNAMDRVVNGLLARAARFKINQQNQLHYMMT